jgi:hypothetical protein
LLEAPQQCWPYAAFIQSILLRSVYGCFQRYSQMLARHPSHLLFILWLKQKSSCKSTVVRYYNAYRFLHIVMF